MTWTPDTETLARRMTRWGVWVATVLVGLSVLVVLGFWVGLRMIDLDAITEQVEASLREATGRSFTIGERPRITLLPRPGVTMGAIALANMREGSREQMLTVHKVRVEISPTGILAGRGMGLRITLSEPDLLLERDKRGAANWSLLVSPDQLLRNLIEALGQVAQFASFEEVFIENGRLSLVDRKTGRDATLGIHSAQAKRLRGEVSVVVTADLKGEEVAMEGRIGVKTDARGLLPLVLKLEAPGAKGKVMGNLRPEWPAVDTALDVSVQITDPLRLSALTGYILGKLPQLKLDAHIAAGDAFLRADPIRLSIGGSDLEGSVEVQQRPSRPRVIVHLEGPSLDLSLGAPAQAPSKTNGGPSPAGGDRVVPDFPLQFPILRKADADVRIDVGRLVLPGGVPLHEISGILLLEAGRLALEPLAFQAGNGQVEVSGVLDASDPRKARVRAKVAGKNVETGSLMTLVMPKGIAVEGGETELAVEVSGIGKSLWQLVGSLDGHVRIILADATLRGVPEVLSGSILSGAFDALIPTAARKEEDNLTCAVANVPLHQGVLSSDQRVGLATDEIEILVSGQVDLGRETLDLALRSNTTGLIPGAADLGGAVRISGTFAKPDVALTTEGTALLGVQVGAALATGGVSFLAERLLHQAVGKPPCETALRKSNGK